MTILLPEKRRGKTHHAGSIKCKMVYRIFAVIARETSFVNLHKFAA